MWEELWCCHQQLCQENEADLRHPAQAVQSSQSRLLPLWETEEILWGILMMTSSRYHRHVHCQERLSSGECSASCRRVTRQRTKIVPRAVTKVTKSSCALDYKVLIIKSRIAKYYWKLSRFSPKYVICYFLEDLRHRGPGRTCAWRPETGAQGLHRQDDQSEARIKVTWSLTDQSEARIQV